MDSPPYLHSISPFYHSYDSSFYSTYNTNTPPSYHTSHFSSTNSFSFHPYQQNPPSYSTYTPPPSYHSSYESTNSEYSSVFYGSNYPVSPSCQVSNTFEPSATTYTLQKPEIPLTVTETDIPIFDGSDDAYGWILCIERYFKARGTPEALKVSEAVAALHGSARQWWFERHYYSEESWESFTNIFLWWFKPEYRDVLPLQDEQDDVEEEAKSELLGVESFILLENLTQEEPTGPIDKEEKEASDSQFFTSEKEVESFAEVEVFSTRTSMVLKDADKGNKLFSDEIYLPLPCDIEISILPDVKKVSGEPPPPPKPLILASLPSSPTPPDRIPLPPLPSKSPEFLTLTENNGPALPPKPPDPCAQVLPVEIQHAPLRWPPFKPPDRRARPPPFSPLFSKASSVSQPKHYKPFDPICLCVASSCPFLKNKSCVVKYDWLSLNVAPHAFYPGCQLSPKFQILHVPTIAFLVIFHKPHVLCNIKPRYFATRGLFLMKIGMEEWDPGGEFWTSTAIGYCRFKQWDPGKIVITSIFFQP